MYPKTEGAAPVLLKEKYRNSMNAISSMSRAMTMPSIILNAFEPVDFLFLPMRILH